MSLTTHHHQQAGIQVILSWLMAALIVGIAFDPVIRVIVFMIMKMYEYFVQGHAIG